MLPVEYIKIGLVVPSYWCISISLVFANKYLVGNSKSKHNVALYTAWVQCIITVLFVVLITSVKALMKGENNVLKKDIMRKAVSPQIMILTCTYVGMLAFNNLCLRYVNVSFYQVARSLTLIFVVIFSLLILKKSVSWRIWFCCLIVACGFVLGIDQEKMGGTLSLSGVIFGGVTSLFVSLNGIFTKKALDVVERDSLQLTFLNNINAVILFLPFIIASGQLHTALTVSQFMSPFYFLFLILTGILGFAIAWISAVQIDLTSPVTHHISANLKAVLQTVIAIVYNGEKKGFLWWLSILMVIGGALLYAVIRLKEEKDQKEKTRADIENELTLTIADEDK